MHSFPHSRTIQQQQHVSLSTYWSAFSTKSTVIIQIHLLLNFYRATCASLSNVTHIKFDTTNQLLALPFIWKKFRKRFSTKWIVLVEFNRSYWFRLSSPRIKLTFYPFWDGVTASDLFARSTFDAMREFRSVTSWVCVCVWTVSWRIWLCSPRQFVRTDTSEVISFISFYT